jgi:hypothetical protein
MKQRAALITLLGACLGCNMAFAQGPCPAGSSRLACVIPLEYGVGGNGQPFSGEGVFKNPDHEGHYNNSISSFLGPVTKEIGRQANLLPLASPSSGVILTYDPSLKTFVTSTDSLGPILGERAETVGRHRLFIGFSYQFFNFDKADSVDLRNFPVVLVHADDSGDNSPDANGNTVTCSASIISPRNVRGCAFVRDLITTANTIDLKVNQYTTYVTFGLTRNVDLSLVIPFENIRMSLSSEDTIRLGTDGTPTSVNDSGTTGLHFDHLWGNCANYPTPGVASAAALDPTCLRHVFPDPTGLAPGGSNSVNSVTGIGDLVARVKWTAWHGERAGVAAGLDLRLPTGDALNFLGSGSYGVKPFAVFSYRARVSPHVLVGYEWNSDSITSGDLKSTTKGSVPSDFVYSAGVDALVAKWLTGSFDIIGQRVFGTDAVVVETQEFLASCGACLVPQTPNVVTQRGALKPQTDVSYNITNASMGIKLRPFPKVSKLVITANVLVRLDEGGLHSKPAPLIGLGYTF